MQSRKLKKMLGADGYDVHWWYGGCVCVGSSLCPDLIKYDPKTKKLKYALGSLKEGRNALKSKTLEQIWDKLQALSDSGEIEEIINGNDIIENPIEIWLEFWDNFDPRIEKFYTDNEKNVTHNGILIRGCFLSEEEARKAVIKHLLSNLKTAHRTEKRLKQELKDYQEMTKGMQRSLLKIRTGANNEKN